MWKGGCAAQRCSVLTAVVLFALNRQVDAFIPTLWLRQLHRYDSAELSSLRAEVWPSPSEWSRRPTDNGRLAEGR